MATRRTSFPTRRNPLFRLKFSYRLDHVIAVSGSIKKDMVDAGLPLFAVCRGIQEMNVAFGGTLHQYLQEVPGRLDHRRPREKPIEQGLAPRHRLKLRPGGLLARLVGGEEVEVNSLHSQGIDRLADCLVVEAVADDGTIEAVSVMDSAGFALGVQLHA